MFKELVSEGVIIKKRVACDDYVFFYKNDSVAKKHMDGQEKFEMEIIRNELINNKVKEFTQKNIQERFDNYLKEHIETRLRELLKVKYQSGRKLGKRHRIQNL
ncbi:MAG: hypothetical protein V8R91_09430 [Butyricimonas faecihominis]